MTRTPADSRQWIVPLLLFLSIAINYVDRGSLSLAAPLIVREMSLSPVRLGLLLSAFFWTYAGFQLVAGWIVDHVDEKWVLAVGFALWSGATAATGLVGSFGALFAVRLLLGVGESVAYPSYSKILVTHYAEGPRGLLVSLIDIGSKCGPAVGILVGGLAMARLGWRPVFVALGIGGLLWLPCWIRWMPRRPPVAAQPADERPSFSEILRHPAAWTTFAGVFLSNYLWYFELTWLPSYLVQERHLSMASMATVGMIPYLVCAASTAVAGTLSFRALARGASVTRVRKACVVAGMGGAALVITVPLIADVRAAVAVLVLTSVFYGIYTSSVWAITQTMAGPLAAGRWTGMQNFVGNLAGIVAPTATGFIVQATGSYFWAFAAAAALALIGAFAYLLGIGQIEPAVWRGRAPRRDMGCVGPEFSTDH
jgi:MFS transporter, ACS family, D-galactonate transporter